MGARWRISPGNAAHYHREETLNEPSPTISSITLCRESKAKSNISPRRYNHDVVVIGAGIAGGIGAVYAHYITVLCPEEMTVALTINLLVIVFIGGVGRLRGVVIGAVLFTVLPEILRIAPTWRLVIYGGLLLAIVIKWPEGLDSAFRRPVRRRPERA